MTFQITFLGHSAYQVEVGGARLLIDPFITGNPVAKVSADSLDADYILLTHGHGDHVGDTLAIAQRTGATVIAIVEVARWIEKQGVEKIFSHGVGGSYTHPFGWVKFVLAQHSSSMPDGSYGGLAAGIVIKAEDKTVYFAGDTGLFSDMQLTGDLGLDMAVLPVGGTMTMDPADSIKAIPYLKPKAVLPCHVNSYPFLAQDLEAWAARIHNETSAQPLLVAVGETFTI